MSGFLLDTNVVSMLSPSRAGPEQAFLDWLDRSDDAGALFLSVVTVHEIEKGIALLEHKGATAKAKALKLWLAGLVSAYDDKIIAVDTAVAARAGVLEAKAIAAGFAPGMADATLAGTACVHDLVIVTSNSKHFQSFGIAVMTPADVVREG